MFRLLYFKLILKVEGFTGRSSVSSKAYQRIHKENIHDQNINLTFDFKLTNAILVSGCVLLVRMSNSAEDRKLSGN